MFYLILIHSAYPQSRPATIFKHLVRPFVPTVQNRLKQNNFQVKTVIATVGSVVLAEGIINENNLVDPQGRPTVTAGSDHCFCTYRPFVCPPSVLDSNQNKFQAKTMFATG